MDLHAEALRVHNLYDRTARLMIKKPLVLYVQFRRNNS